MEKSYFQLKEQSIINVEFIKNEFFENKDISVNIDFSHNTEIININNNNAYVILTFNVFNKEFLENYPFFVKVVIKGNFFWDSQISPERLNNLLNINAPAVLLSFVRSIIAQLTAFSGFPALIIPLINFQK